MIQKIFAAAAAKSLPDVLFVDQSWLPGFLKEEMLEPVPDAKAKAWLAAVTPEIKELSDYGKGRMWGYPQYGIDVYGLTWNKDHFKEAGLDPEKPPKTWAEFREYAKKLTKRDAQGNITRVGYAIRHVGHPHGVVHKHLWAIWGAGADLIDNPLALRGGKAAFNNEGGKAALQFVLDMLDVDKSTSLNFPDPRAAFLKGIASMQISETVSIRSRQPKEAPDLKWGVALPPLRKAGDKPVTNLNAWMYTVPKGAKSKAQAWGLIEWINSPGKDYDLCKKYDATPRYVANWDKEPFKSESYNQALKAMYPYGRKYPINLGLNGIMDAAGAAIQKVWHHEASVDAALVEAERLANKAIAEAAK
jgi:ABC-type glycerol-3-phosphate transport system substrate-binding protein